MLQNLCFETKKRNVSVNTINTDKITLGGIINIFRVCVSIFHVTCHHKVLFQFDFLE